MRKNKNGLPEHTESRIIKTKAEKIIFIATIVLYTVIMISELKFTPHHNTISSSVAALGLGVFLIARAVHIKKTRELIFAKDKVTWLLIIAASVVLIASGIWWIISEYVI
ncbi:hypothetical protein [Porcipelethomonas sp.]|uniref:hypothetical protein n=1 Tax=Porcipelethomonas sp. TaxID=2981675 RepID=UPI003EFA5D4E